MFINNSLGLWGREFKVRLVVVAPLWEFHGLRLGGKEEKVSFVRL
jgi:hypothetical protein